MTALKLVPALVLAFGTLGVMTTPVHADPSTHHERLMLKHHRKMLYHKDKMEHHRRMMDRSRHRPVG